jgi:hypothetical protein
VSAVQVGSGDGGDEKLGSVGVPASVGHGEESRLVVLQNEVLVREFEAVDGLSAGTVSSGEVSSLEYDSEREDGERTARNGRLAQTP